jgi:hypothetical protein
LNYKLETFVSPIPDQEAWAVDAMTISWKGMFNYIFPPFRLLHKIFTQDKGGWLQDHSNSSGLAKAILVTGSPTIIVCKTASSCLERGPFVSIQGKEASLRPGENSTCTHGCYQDIYQTERFFCKSNQAHLWSS